MIEVGRVCLKTAGRDAGKTAIIVEKLEGNFVLVDGNVRRKRCNILHLEPTQKKLEIAEKASSEEVKAAMKAAGIEVEERRKKEEAKKEKAAKPQRKRAK